MRKLAAFLILLAIGNAQVDEYCQNKSILGFEDAEFLVGKEVAGQNPQEVINSLLVGAGQTLISSDTFVTQKTFFELLRIQETNELVLLTLNQDYVCFYKVPTEEPTWHTDNLS